jgi:hypothetical protein
MVVEKLMGSGGLSAKEVDSQRGQMTLCTGSSLLAGHYRTAVMASS